MKFTYTLHQIWWSLSLQQFTQLIVLPVDPASRPITFLIKGWQSYLFYSRIKQQYCHLVQQGSLRQAIVYMIFFPSTTALLYSVSEDGGAWGDIFQFSVCTIFRNVLHVPSVTIKESCKVIISPKKKAQNKVGVSLQANICMYIRIFFAGLQGTPVSLKCWYANTNFLGVRAIP